ncbi:hypothetical protein FTUN_6074 [Frigoriglobus tundricola]|uniref:RNA polymerase sigma-70 region 2 domain-containing protein n=2 Tax=Frigoriglobus tundricola TaxID=2774151 RepID=A0A6M5YY85_9BACT|nr:hypothetical protein FTUN_6074 [Frigoriglobus tundricola]
MNELLLLHQAQNGDSGALTLLVDELHPRVLNFVRISTRGRHSAEDIVQVTWVRFLQKLGTFDFTGAGQLRTWLFRTAYHVALECGHRPLTPLSPTSAVLTGLVAAGSEHQPAFDESDLNAVQEVMRVLRATEWLIVRLFGFDGLSHREIVELGVLGLRDQQESRSLLHEARRTLGAELRRRFPQLAERLLDQE